MTAARIVPTGAPALPAAPQAGTPLEAWRPEDGFLFQRSGRGLAGMGIEAVETLPPRADQLHAASAAAERLLGAVEGTRRDQAVAVAALPYDGAVASRILVPAHLLRSPTEAGSTKGSTEQGTSRSAAEAAMGGLSGAMVRDHTPRRLGARPIDDRRPRTLTVREEPGAQAYAEAVSEAIRRIHAGDLDKVVLARCLLIEGAMLDRAASIVTRLSQADPACYTFAVPGVTAGELSLFVGATPELLLRRSGLTVRSTPLGGSTPRSPDPVADREAGQRLLASEKDRHEHCLVVEAVTDTLAPFCSELQVVDELTLTGTAGMWHLGSTVRGTLRPSAPSALGLAAALHPTPAICGTPRAAALRAIHELETVPRGLYSGIVGWVDARGDGEWAVAIRCAELTAGRARLYAGAGIVEGSDPDAEVAETAGKFSALVDALMG